MLLKGLDFAAMPTLLPSRSRNVFISGLKVVRQEMYPGEEKIPTKSDLQKLEQGIVLDGKKTWPARLRVLKKKNDLVVIEIIIHEGKKRQVRKMFQAVGHPVIRLKRTAYGKLRLGKLTEGTYCFLGKNDIKKLFL